MQNPKVVSTMYPYTSPDAGAHSRIQRQSRYLTMRDGTELAVDIWMPAALDSGTQLPTLLHQTRYWRLPQLRWPFSWISDGLIGNEGAMVKALVRSGYVFVNVDCRGSGASFGSRMHPWSPPEVLDGRDIADWIIAQPWSNGKIGTVGISYTGTAAEFAMGLQHPAIKATMALFSLYDVYDDIALPGGIPHDGFVLEWGRFNASLDQNKIPTDNPLAHLLVRGVAPVERGREGAAKFAAALQDHLANVGVHETSAGIEYRDQAPKNGIIESMDAFSPHAHQEAANQSGAALLSLSGWRDGAYPHSAIRRFLNSNGRVNRLILGPWDHGGKHHITPGKERKLRTELASETIKFFDHYLKGYQTGIEKEPKVQYFTMQAEQWHAAETWPPPGTTPRSFFLHHDGSLDEHPSDQVGLSRELVHHPAQGTGTYTRWRGLLMSVGTGKLYPDRKKRDQLLACFDTMPLTKALEVTGHGEVKLYIRTEEPDGSFFVYLEDITPGGEVWYVTEGEIRALHRWISPEQPPYRDVVPYHSYLKKDAATLPSGEVVEIVFDLLPISYLFKKGHRIRVAIATGDCDNFRQLCRTGSRFELLMGGAHCSSVTLPWMQKRE